MKRCPWKGLEDSIEYQTYHDTQWGVPCKDDQALFELFILETFHCGLSWLLVLKKRTYFQEAYEGFDPMVVAEFGEDKVKQLMENPKLIRNRKKILASIENAKAFLAVVEEFGSFSDYLWGFTQHQVLYFPFDGVTNRNEYSDTIAKDLKKRGFRFMGSVTCYSYLEAVGIFHNHSVDCDWYHSPDSVER